MNYILINAAMQLPVFLFAIVVHEWGHAWMAKAYGDNTAELRWTTHPQPDGPH